MDTLGYDTLARTLMENYYTNAMNDQSIYKHLSLSMYYSFNGDMEQAIEHLKLFAEVDGYYYWILLFLEQDPLAKPLLEHPEFEGIMDTLHSRFQEKHEKLKEALFEKGLLN